LATRLTRPAPAPAPTRIDSEGGSFRRPATLEEALTVLTDHPDATVVAGSTDVGVEVNLRGRRPAYVVAVERLPELRGLEVSDDSATLGAALTLSELEEGLAGRVPLLDQVWPQFASRLIRNGATLGGNIATASPIGDLPPALLALEATVLLVSLRGEREVPLADYFTGYRETVREPDELIRAVRVPLPSSPLVAFHKIAKRRFDDISGVAIGFALHVVDGTVRRARIGLGGVAATPIRALATEAALEGRPWTEETVAVAAEVMRGEGTPINDMRASAAYRSAMLGNALPRLWASGGFEARFARTSTTGETP
ncbi:MAG: FAD binding domain-containing protein, partial [Nocardioides sp.]